MTNYSELSHRHCFDQTGDSPCGMKGEHRCCLCGKYPMTQDKSVEEIAEKIYNAFPYNTTPAFNSVTKPAWVPNGNSIMQDSARRVALDICTTFTTTLQQAREEALTEGRVSVLRDFDNMCQADAFMGFTDAEWSAIRKFFAFNKKISNWDK